MRPASRRPPAPSPHFGTGLLGRVSGFLVLVASALLSSTERHGAARSRILAQCGSRRRLVLRLCPSRTPACGLQMPHSCWNPSRISQLATAGISPLTPCSHAKGSRKEKNARLERNLRDYVIVAVIAGGSRCPGWPHRAGQNPCGYHGCGGAASHTAWLARSATPRSMTIQYGA